MYLKKVTAEDCLLLFDWVNDADVRNSAFNTSRITFEEHIKWFYDKLKSDSSIIYIAYERKVPIGQIRIDIESETGVISYSIAKGHRGKGYGTILLNEVSGNIKKDNFLITLLIGKVKYSNIASQKAFEKAGYDHIRKDEYIEYYKDI